MPVESGPRLIRMDEVLRLFRAQRPGSYGL